MDSELDQESAVDGTSLQKVPVSRSTSQDSNFGVLDQENTVLPCTENSATTTTIRNNCSKIKEQFVEESEPCVTLKTPRIKLDHPKISNLLSKLRFVFISIVSFIITGAVVYLTLLKQDDNEDTRANSSEPDNSTVPTKLRFIERAEWGGQPPTESLTKLKLPVPYVIISHTATEFCKTQSECSFRVRFAQTFDIELRGWFDIAYNFLVGGDGYAYVGRGWDYVGAHAYNYNTRSIGITFIGTFNTVIPPNEHLFAAQELITLGVKMGKISPDYKLIARRQISTAVSPGDALYNVIKTWPHWSNVSSV